MDGRLRQQTDKRRTAGFDRAVRELNAFLLVLAIGLAVLDATCFIAFEVRDSLPSATLANAGPAAAMPLGGAQSLTALSPSKPSASAGGW